MKQESLKIEDVRILFVRYESNKNIMGEILHDLETKIKLFIKKGFVQHGDIHFNDGVFYVEMIKYAENQEKHEPVEYKDLDVLMG